MRRRWVLAVVVAFIAADWWSNGNVGASSQCRDGQCVVSASSSWIAIGIALGLGTFLLFYRQRVYAPDPSKVVGIWRRFGAFLVDFVSVLLIVSPVAALAVLAVEARYTGAFEWSFTREYSRPTDSAYFSLGALAGFAALFLYFYRHAQLGRPTLGQYLLGYQVTPSTGGKPRYALRVLLSFAGLCMWPVSVIFALTNPRKMFWWDDLTRTKVVRVVG